MIDHTDVWDLSTAEFPENAPPKEQLKFLLRYAILAPSIFNSQPWMFRIQDRTIELYGDQSRSCRISDPEGRQLAISCAAALFNLRAALKHFGRLGAIHILPDEDDPELLATIRLGEGADATKDEMELFYAIPERRTNRQEFQGDQPEPELLDRLRTAAESEGAWLETVTDDAVKRRLADLIADSDRELWENKRYRLEFAVWVRHALGATDGLPSYAQGQTDLLSYAGPMAVRTFELADGQAAYDHDLAAYSPALLVLGTNGETRRDWINAGMALQHTLLRAKASGFDASFLNQPIELPGMRTRVAELVGRAGHPQIILRVGIADEVRPTPRRDVGKTLI